MTARTTAHPTGDHWIAPSDRALFGSPPLAPPAPQAPSAAPEATGEVDEAFDALREAAEAAAAAAEIHMAHTPAPELTLVHGQRKGLRNECLSLLHELTGDLAALHATPTPRTQTEASVTQLPSTNKSLLHTPVSELLRARRQEVAS